MKWNFNFVLVIFVTAGECQRPPSLPVSPESWVPLARALFGRPRGRTPTLDNIIIRHYTTNFSSPTSYKIVAITKLLTEPTFDLKKPTHFYTHGYIELPSDQSVSVVVNAYLARGEHNILLVDWSNLAFGSYLAVARDVSIIGRAVGDAIYKLIMGGVSLGSLHFVGHSLGSHVLALAARHLNSKGYKIPRLTGLDPAYPGFYSALLPVVARPMNQSDALFVNSIHTDGGWLGAPGPTSHADFWPNGGQAKQPGCPTPTIPFTTEDFCSHWRSWAFWAESVTGGAFQARRCADYDTFLRGQCLDEPIVNMGLRATANLRGNYYLRTAAKSPYALGEHGAR